MREQEKKNRDALFRLMREHPELPVVPMVNSEIIADDYCSYWMGNWGKAGIAAYIVGDERIYFREDDSDDMENVLNHTKGGQDWYEAPEAKVEEAYRNLPWTEAIIVYIEMPEQN